MVQLLKKHRIQSGKDRQLKLDNHRKTLVYQKGSLLFGFNFHPWRSYDGCFLPVPQAGSYQVVLSSDDYCYGGHGRIWHQTYETVEKDGVPGILLYLPSRTAVILKKV